MNTLHPGEPLPRRWWRQSSWPRGQSPPPEQVEAPVTAGSAQLLEIASTASRVRRELVAAPEPARSADGPVQRLRRETAAADEARREAGRRAQAARQRQRS